MRVPAGAAGDSERERKDEDSLPTHVHPKFPQGGKY